MYVSHTGLAAKTAYVLALAPHPDGTGTLEPLSAFTTNPAGAAVVSAIGPIRQQIKDPSAGPRRYLVIVAGTPDPLGTLVRAQAP